MVYGVEGEKHGVKETFEQDEVIENSQSNYSGSCEKISTRNNFSSNHLKLNGLNFSPKSTKQSSSSITKRRVFPTTIWYIAYYGLAVDNSLYLTFSDHTSVLTLFT